MAYVNYTNREINAKIVYYGPGLSGKTTNILYIHKKLNPDSRGKLVSLATQTDRTLFFDFLPVNVGEIGNFKIRIHLYTVPGQIFYNTTRKMVLKGVDGVVFVADSQKQMLEDNIESLNNLEENLKEYGKSIHEIPLVIQYNKRDLPDAMDLEDLHRHLNRYKAPFFTAVATQGQGVLETLTGICKLVINKLKKTAGILETEKDTFEDEMGKISGETFKRPEKKVLLPDDYSDEALKMLDVFGIQESQGTNKIEEIQEDIEPIEEDILILEEKAKELIKEKEELRSREELKDEEESGALEAKEEDIIIIETESIGVRGNEIELPLKIMAGGKEKAIKIRLKIEVGEE